MSLSGTEIWALLLPLSPTNREAKIASLFAQGEIPNFLSTDPWPPVTVEGVSPKSKTFHTLTYYPAPSYFALGTDADPAYLPVRHWLFSQIAASVHCVMPTRKMVRDTWDAAHVKMPLSDVKGKPYFVPLADIEKTSSMKLQSDMTKASALYKAPGEKTLIAGFKKDLVTGPNQDGSMGPIYGGAFSTVVSSSAPVDSRFWQGYPGPHDKNYMRDASEGERLYLDACFLDGKPAKLSEICESPELSYLVSDQGPFPLRWPNVGPGGAKVSTVPTPATPPPAASGSATVLTPAGTPMPRGDSSSSNGMRFGDKALVFFGFVGATASIIGLFGSRSR